MHPRAVNFNPEADENIGCNYYQLQAQLDHTTNSGATFTYGYWLNDNDGTPFYIIKMPFVMSNTHLYKSNSTERITSIEEISVVTYGSTRTSVEDNFGAFEVSSTAADLASWIELGDFDSIEFRLGLPDAVRSTNPAKISPETHPLGSNAAINMHNDNDSIYYSTYIRVVLPNTQDTLRFEFYDNWDFAFPYNVTAVDGQNVPINLRLNYNSIFNGLSFTNDDSTTICNKIRQNLPAAVSMY